jgi:hypothetical protein
MLLNREKNRRGDTGEVRIDPEWLIYQSQLNATLIDLVNIVLKNRV